MTEQEKINAEVQTKLAMQDAKISVFTQEMKDFKDEMRDFKNEMRDRDNQRAAEIRDRDNKWNEEIREIRASLQNLQTSSRTLNITTIIGIAALVVAVLLK